MTAIIAYGCSVAFFPGAETTVYQDASLPNFIVRNGGHRGQPVSAQKGIFLQAPEGGQGLSIFMACWMKYRLLDG
jgi:hypothetical protein